MPTPVPQYRYVRSDDDTKTHIRNIARGNLERVRDVEDTPPPSTCLCGASFIEATTTHLGQGELCAECNTIARPS